MLFNETDNSTDPTLLEYEKSHRILQPIWDYIIDGREDMLRSPMFPPMLVLVFHLLATTPFTIVDLFFSDLPAVKTLQLRPSRQVTWPMIGNVLMNALWNVPMLILPLATAQLIWVSPLPLPTLAPTLFQFLWHQIAFFVINDFLYWMWHVLHHKVRFLYRWCHSVHHQYHMTFALATHYMHPWELFNISLLVTVVPWPFKPHCFTYWSWLCLASWSSIEIHLGYNLPWGLHRFIPFFGGAPAHDIHHVRPMSNYGSLLTVWDSCMGWNLTHKDLEEMKKKVKKTQ